MRSRTRSVPAKALRFVESVVCNFDERFGILREFWMGHAYSDAHGQAPIKWRSILTKWKLPDHTEDPLCDGVCAFAVRVRKQ
jgi:hypothetical protein